MKFSIFKRGVSLYLALIIMFILIAIGLGVSLIIVSQMKMMKGMGDSVVAFYAADTGIEQALYEKRVNGIDWSGNGSVGGANYTVNYTGNSEAKWQSKGTFQGVNRAIEITHPIVFDFSISLSGTAPYFSYDQATNTYSAHWCPSEGYSPEPITLTTQLISGTDRGITYSYTSDNPDVTSGFDKPACTPTGGCATTVNCSSVLCFTIGGSSDVFFTLTISGATDILTKQVILYGIWDRPPCMW
jgi:hypothetical protein